MKEVQVIQQLSTIAQVAQEIKSLEEMLQQYEDNPDLLEAALREYLNESSVAQGQIQRKIDEFCDMMERLENDATWAEKRMAEEEVRYKLRCAPLIAKRNKCKGIAFRMQTMLLQFLNYLGTKHYETSKYKLTKGKAGGKRRLTLLVDQGELLPEQFQKVTVEVDKDAVRQELESSGKDELIDEEKGVVFARLEKKGDKLTLTYIGDK